METSADDLFRAFRSQIVNVAIQVLQTTAGQLDTQIQLAAGLDFKTIQEFATRLGTLNLSLLGVQHQLHQKSEHSNARSIGLAALEIPRKAATDADIEALERFYELLAAQCAVLGGADSGPLRAPEPAAGPRKVDKGKGKARDFDPKKTTRCLPAHYDMHEALCRKLHAVVKRFLDIQNASSKAVAGRRLHPGTDIAAGPGVEEGQIDLMPKVGEARDTVVATHRQASDILEATAEHIALLEPAALPGEGGAMLCAYFEAQLAYLNQRTQFLMNLQALQNPKAWN